jgi:adenosylcobyric acid synthase
VPHFADAARLPAEDGLGLRREGRKGSVCIAVPMTPWISNFDDLDPLREEPGVEVILVEPGEPLPPDAVLVLLPGSKTTIDDLLFIRRQGWDIDVKAHVRRGGRVLGLCGGYQMLGQRIDDPFGIEGEAGRSIEGLGLLDVATTLTATKRLEGVTGATIPDGVPLSGYEMHIGETSGPDASRRPFAQLANGQADGAISADGRVTGTYVHGLFADDRQRARWLNLLGAETSDLAYESLIDDILDRFADHLEAHLDCERLLQISVR